MPGDRLIPGKPIRARILDAFAGAAARLGHRSAAAPVSLRDLPSGPIVSINVVRKIPARLQGAANPYSWSEVLDAPTLGFPTLPNGRSGSGNAFEVNDA